MTKNEHIDEYLDFYLTNKEAKNFAVLLNGEWGAGKTYFIKKYLEKNKAQQKFVYISLYGVANTSEIEEQIFQQLHPILASKPVAILSKVLKGALKLGLKVDLDGNETSADVSIPDIKGSEIFKNLKDAILVFDDLERCAIEPEIILGYINYFVEHQDHKVIVIANEQEIKTRIKQEETRYQQIKEKLVGRSFTIKPTADVAMDHFISAVHESEAKKALTKNRDLILKYYEASTYNNLRSLHQVICEFPRLFRDLPQKAKNNENLISNIIRTILVFSFETRKGAISIEQLSSISKHPYRWHLEKDKKEPDPVGDIEKKYPNFAYEKICPSDECWYQFFKNGKMDPTSLNLAIDNSEYFANENAAKWAKLWHFNNLEEVEFQKTLDSVRKSFVAHEYTKPGVIKHVAALYLFFARKRMINESLTEVSRWLHDEINRLAKLKKIEIEEKIFRDDESYGSLGFVDCQSAEFKKIIARLKKIDSKLKEEKYPSEAQVLLDKIKSNPRHFWEALSYRFSGGHKYTEIPILSYLSPKDFVAAFVACPNKDKDEIWYAFKDRYSAGPSMKKIIAEKNWMKRVKRLLRQKAKTSPPFSRHIINNFCDGILDIGMKNLTDVEKLP